MAERISKDLSERGLAIPSGLALDLTRAHQKVHWLQLQGASIGVLGCPSRVVYVKQNKRIFEQIERRRG